MRGLEGQQKVAMATVSSTSGSFFVGRTASGGKTFLSTSASALSPVQRMVQEQKQVAQTQTNYFESEDWLRIKAMEISYRISLYKNLGLTAEYQAAQAEGTEVVKKYQALLQKQKESGGTDTTA